MLFAVVMPRYIDPAYKAKSASETIKRQESQLPQR